MTQVRKKKDRSEYYHEYYETVTRPKKAKAKAVKAVSRPGSKYLRYVDVKKAVIALKKQIGQVNMDLVLDAIERVEKE